MLVNSRNAIYLTILLSTIVAAVDYARIDDVAADVALEVLTFVVPLSRILDEAEQFAVAVAVVVVCHVVALDCCPDYLLLYIRY